MKLNVNRALIIYLLLIIIIILQYQQISKSKSIITEQQIEINRLTIKTGLADLIIDEQEVLENKMDILKGEYRKLKEKRFLTEDDIKVLERITEAEATGEGLRGKVLVSCVILNRFNKSPNKSIRDIVFEKRQFSPISDGRYYKVKITNETKKAVELATWRDYSYGSLYFLAPKYADRSNARWFERELQYVTSHNSHLFYR